VSDFLLNKKLSYRKQIARQLRTKYAGGIHSNSVILKSRLGSLKIIGNDTKIDRSHTNSYCIVTMALLRYSYLLVENRKNFYTPSVFSAPAGGGDPVRISRRCLILIKLEWLGYRMVKKLWQYVKPLPQNTGTWRTDRQTDGQTDRIAISISRVSVLSRDKN